MGKFDTKRLDKVEAPPRYRVDATVETHDEEKGKGQERHEEDEYSASSGVKGWQKYHTDAKNRKALKLRSRDIAKIFFNPVSLQRGLVIIDTDLVLVNRQILANAHLFSTHIDTYWKLKKFKEKQEIPAEDLLKEEYIEVSVLQKGRVVRTERATDADTRLETQTNKKITKRKAPWLLLDPETDKINWIPITILLGVAIALIIVMLVIW